MSRLVRLYPGPWRERYEAEFLQLIEDRPPSPMERLDIIRGALDARLHPQVVEAAPEPMPWTHRLPGLLSLSAGLALCLAVLGISFGPGPDWGAAASFLGIAVILMPISLPGDYLGSQLRTSGSAARVISRATTGSASRPRASSTGRRRGAWTATRSRSIAPAS